MMDPYIKHAYSSKYYDPAKAHEYYMRNRNLKGRRNTKGLGKEKREVWETVKTNVMPEKKGTAQKNREKTAKEIETVRAKSKAVRENISAKLKAWLEQITSTAQSQRKLLTIPETASAEQKAHLRELNAIRKAEITGQAESERASTREESRKERERVAGELKVAISKIRDKTKKVREAFNESTNKTLDSELEKIKKSS